MMLLVMFITIVKCTQVFSLICIIPFVNICNIASGMCLPKTVVKKGGRKVIPGWNERVQDDQDTFLCWRDIWV